ncbi:hypothetical protein GS429_20760 [Natronorubrum sp. JWXQ-INN-674]|uniref:Uncharacterized protein n=1 Tax=Natronorubrum halalkaliphilum TaxID=2691917 RepID=A0A6B0VSS7_9EURY|nr:hypothetical protein [Natronorubrum halalkaliphilum]MXV64455.1 hypothetical protein [Natronorubrum halalkaliphilum]
MVDSLVAGLGVVAVLLSAGSAVMFVRYRRRTRARRALADALEARLADAMGPGTGTHLEQAPTVRRIAVVDADSKGDGETERPAFVPVIRINLETTDAPGMKLIFEYVADALETVHPELEARKERVHRYDVEFTFGPGGLLVDGECRRVSVTPELATQLLEEEGFGAFELRRAIERADRDADGDGDTPTTLWVEC